MKFQSKFLLLALATLLLVISMGGCSPTASPTPNAPAATAVVQTAREIQMINPMGPAVIPLAGLSSGSVAGNLKINIKYWKTVDEATGFMAGDTTPFAVLPITTAANMSASGIDMVLLGVHEWKVFYLIASENSTFDGWKSLVGKTVYSPEGKGQTVDVLTRYALSKENIKPDQDVTFAYAPAQEIVALFKEGKIDYAALPEPFVTQALSASKGSKVVLDYQEYWSKDSGAKNGIPVAGLFVKRDYLNQHPDDVKEMVSLFSQSVQWSNDHVKESIQASSKVLPYPEAVMLAALKRIKFEYVAAADAREDTMLFLTTIQKTYPDGVKKLPDDKFFK
jgi:NitT/TauT family transport system substrate-binding protein